MSGVVLPTVPVWGGEGGGGDGGGIGTEAGGVGYEAEELLGGVALAEVPHIQGGVALGEALAVFVDHQGDVSKLAEEPEEPGETAGGEMKPEQKTAIWKDSLNRNPGLLDYGKKNAEIIDYAIVDEKGVITSSIVKGTDFSVMMKVKFHETIEDPIFAFTVKDLQGTDITGTNTMYEKQNTGTVNAGEERIITFRQHMDLQGKSYLLSFGCVGFEKNEFEVYHRLYDACELNVISDKNTVGFYDMNSRVTIENGERS